MKRRVLHSAVALLAGTGPAPALRAQPAIAFTNVTVLDGRSPSPRRAQTVIVRGARIVAVGPAARLRPPAGARVVNGTGRFLVPGLWDMHVHLDVPAGAEVLPLYVANGVTGVRDMASEWSRIREFRSAIANGHLIGPRIVSSGPYLEGAALPIPHLLARSPEEGRAAVDSLVALGVDFIKIHNRLSRDTYFAVARRARERGIAFAGHVPAVVGSQAAADSGQRSLEHLLNLPMPCTPAESLALQPRYRLQSALGRCTSADLRPLYARFVRAGAWITPTLTAIYQISSWPRRDVPGDSLARFIPDTLEKFVDAVLQLPDSVPAGADSVGLAVFALRVRQVADMHAAGVRILAGTDAPLRNSPPGFGLHEELWLMSRYSNGRLSNYDLFRMATYEPARYFGTLAREGTVQAGRVADLLLLDANPLEDIRNLRRIAGVMAQGRYLDASARRRLLAIPTD